MPENKTKSSIDKAVLIASSALDKKAEDTVILEVIEQSGVADYFVICSAVSARGTEAIADNVEKTLRKNNIKIVGIEGKIKKQWILIDVSDIIVHIFYAPFREFYDIEGIYFDSPRIEMDTSVVSSTQTNSVK